MDRTLYDILTNPLTEEEEAIAAEHIAAEKIRVREAAMALKRGTVTTGHPGANRVAPVEDGHAGNTATTPYYFFVELQ